MKSFTKCRITAILTACLLFSAAAFGQDGKTAVFKEGDHLHIQFALNGSEVEISANEQLTVTPVVIGNGNRQELSPVVFTGRIRQKVNERRERLYGTPVVPAGTFSNVIVRRKPEELPGTAVVYAGEIPYEPWMAGGRLVLYRELNGCAGHRMALAPLVAAEIAAPLQPKLTFIVPDHDALKQRSERITAVVHFPQGRSVLLRGFADNSRQLARIDSLTAGLLAEQGFALDTIYLKGFASPEATYAFNTRLSANRVRAIRQYLLENFDLVDTEFVTDTEPEDWDSLRRWVVLSELPARDEVLAVIDTVRDPDARDAGIRSIDNGKTYNKLLREVYPQLRRVDYRIGYVVPAYTLEESRELIDTHPERLSLTEICTLAASYPIDSPERAHACAVAMEYYPDDPCACNNMAMLALRRGDTQAAHQYLSRCGSDPRVQNNLGVLCLIEGDTQKAQHCFSLAAKNGSEEAAYNLANFSRLDNKL